MLIFYNLKVLTWHLINITNRPTNYRTKSDGYVPTAHKLCYLIFSTDLEPR